MQKYEVEYNSIVKRKKTQVYLGPERQASIIKKCSILKQTREIEYSNSVRHKTKEG